MNELWHDLVDLLRRRPLLWLPVLVADLLGYLVNLGRLAWLKNFVYHRMMQHSVLGGAVVQTPLTAAQVQSTTVLALLLSWFSYFIRLLLYSGAFLVTASLVYCYLRDRRRSPDGLTARQPNILSGALELALRALVVYITAALLFSWLSSYLAKHGYTAVLQNAWFGLALGLIVLLLLSTWLPPVAIRVLTGAVPAKSTISDSQLLAASIAIVVTLLSAIVGTNSRQMAHLSQAARYPLEIVGSLVVALPYVLLFTGLALLAHRTAHSPEMT